MDGLKRFIGRVALVTGASSGIGRAVAKSLAEEGLQVVATGRRAERLDGLAGLESVQGRIHPIPADLRSESEIASLFTAIRDELGGVDVLVNNAGLGRHAPLCSGETELWREMLEVNVLALCVCTREAIADMQRRGFDGHVIHLGSMAGHRVPLGSGVYSATKYAVRALTEALRGELRAQGSKIRVSCISPGFVETEFAEVYHGSREKAVETYSQFKVLEAEDLAGAVRYVLSAPPHMQVHDLLIRPTEQVS